VVDGNLKTALQNIILKTFGLEGIVKNVVKGALKQKRRRLFNGKERSTLGKEKINGNYVLIARNGNY